MSAIQPASGRGQKLSDLQASVEQARLEHNEAEADLAREQAAVNAFRMHCRLKLDAWINQLLELQTEKQRLRTRLELLRQAAGTGRVFDEDDPFWQGEENHVGHVDEQEEELLLPTDTPRDKAAEQRIYRQLARKYHPDLSWTAVEIAYRTEMMSAVNIAYASGDTQALYDLADRIDPADLVELGAIDRADLRELRMQLARFQGRKRRAQRRQAALRQENTARLWQKAKLLETDDIHWWDIVRKEIDAAISRIKEETADLNSQIKILEDQPVRPSQ